MVDFIIHNANYVITTITAILVALITATINSFIKMKEINKQQESIVNQLKEKEKHEIRTQYIDPLRIAANDLSLMIDNLIQELNKGDEKKGLLLRSYSMILDCNWQNKYEYRHQCNCGMYQAMSSLYITAIYFSRAYTIRSKLPFIKNPLHDQNLLTHLTKVREEFGGEFGIWETIQDSLGQYVTKEDGSIITYRDFYEQIGDTETNICYQNLIRFYKFFEKKQDSEICRIKLALSHLIKYIEDNFKMLEY